MRADHEREIYHSENGDRWLLCRADDGRSLFSQSQCFFGGKVTSSNSEISEKGSMGPSIKRLPA